METSKKNKLRHEKICIRNVLSTSLNTMSFALNFITAHLFVNIREMVLHLAYKRNQYHCCIILNVNIYCVCFDMTLHN